MSYECNRNEKETSRMVRHNDVMKSHFNRKNKAKTEFHFHLSKIYEHR